MKVKNSNLQWYVLKWDSMQNKIVNYNVLTGVAEDLYIEVKAKRVSDRNLLKKYLQHYFMYNYWGKAEHEMYISDLYGNHYEKIDIWRQIKPNLDLIVDYVNTKCDLKFK